MALEHLRLLEPVLEDLRRQLDEVAQHAGARQALVGDVREQAVQAVAELVEERARVVEAEQRRRARCGLREVVVVDDDRQHRVASRAVALLAFRLPAVRAHPRTAALARPREVVVQEDADRTIGGVSHFVDAHFGVVDADVVARDEAQTEESRRAVERGLDHPLERKVGLDLGLVEVVAHLADLLGVEAPVPRLDDRRFAARERQRRQCDSLLLDARLRRRPDALEQRRHGRLALRHRVAEGEVGVARVAVQARLLQAQGRGSRRRRRGCRWRRHALRARSTRARPARAGRAVPRR